MSRLPGGRFSNGVFGWIFNRCFHQSYLCHADETGININGDRLWLHCVSNDWWTYYLPHEKRGFEAMVTTGVLPYFQGILCHDHWKPYFKLDCQHSLCNAHHLRELERAWEQDKQTWAKDVGNLLLQINSDVDDSTAPHVYSP